MFIQVGAFTWAGGEVFCLFRSEGRVGSGEDDGFDGVGVEDAVCGVVVKGGGVDTFRVVLRAVSAFRWFASCSFGWMVEGGELGEDY